MLILAPTHFMVLSIILTNRVNKTLITITPRNKKLAMASRASWIRGRMVAGTDAGYSVAAGFFSPPGRRNKRHPLSLSQTWRSKVTP